jgi:hypothetical protein
MKIVMGNLCNIDEVNNEVYIVVITKRIDDGIKIIKKNKYYVDNFVGNMIHYYIPIEISYHYIFSNIGNSIDNFNV